MCQILRCPHADLFGGEGRAWGCVQDLPEDELDAVEQHIQEYDRLSEALKAVERDIARTALADENVTRLMTIPGIDMVIAVSLMAAIGKIERFERPDQLASHGRITKRGRSNARLVLVEAAWQTVRSPRSGPAGQGAKG